MIALAAALLLAAEAPARDDFTANAWGHFSRAPDLARSSETVDIVTRGRTGDALIYRLRLVRRSLSAGPREHWADSRTCPAVNEVLAGARALVPPAVSPPAIGDNASITLHGVRYSIRMPSRDGSISWTSNVGTPLATWVGDSLARLRPCWRPVLE